MEDAAEDVVHNGGAVAEETRGDKGTQETVAQFFKRCGLRLTDSNEVKGGIEYLLQNSSADKPFLTVGCDLLLAMEVKHFAIWKLI